MLKKTGFYVLGGQYASYCHGWCRTILGAKRLARKSQEYWDNWAGWHTPSIFAAADCEVRETFHGEDVVPNHECRGPVAWYKNGKWEE